MATTSTELRSADGVQLAWAFVIEGLPVACTTWTSNADMQTAWTGTDWASETWFRGLDLLGNIGQTISLLDSKVEWDSVQFRVVDDDDDRLAGIVCREAHSTAAKTFLTADFHAGANMSVESTGAFASSGTVYLGRDTYAYAGKTANAFTTCTPKYALFTRQSGQPFTGYHAVPTSDVGGRVEVWNQPRGAYNRRCALYLHHIDPTTGAPIARSSAKLMWVGCIKDAPKDNGDGSLTFEAWSIKEELNKNLLEDQYTAKLAEGFYLLPAHCNMRLHSRKLITGGGAYTAKTPDPVQLFATAGYRTLEDVYAAIAQEMFDLRAGGDMYGTDSGVSVGETLTIDVSTDGNTYEFTIGLDPLIWQLLGWPSEDGSDRTEGLVEKRFVKVSGENRHRLTAPEAPITVQWSARAGERLRIDATSVTGVWGNQPTMPPGMTIDADGGTANGFVMIDGIGVYAVNKTDATTFKVVKDVSHYLAPLDASSVEANGALRRVRGGGGVELKQVWIEEDQTGAIFQRLIVSTGTDDYNVTDADVYPRNMGLGIPHSLIEQWGVYFLSPAAYWLILTKPTPFLELLEPALAMRNAHLVFRSGQLQVRRIGSVPSGSEDWQLAETNKAGGGPDRTTVTRGASSMVNNAVLKYDADVKGDLRNSVTILDASSIAEHGKSKTYVIKGYGVYRDLFGTGLGGLNDWITATVSSMAHWARPIAFAERTIDLSLSEAVPGDSVSLTDNYCVAPTTGQRGLSNWPGYLVKVDYNWRAPASSRATIALFPTFDPAQSAAAWAPTAQVASSSVASSKLTVTCDAHRYSLSTEDADATRFDVGDKVLLTDASPTDPASPTTYALTVDSQSGNDITFTTDPVPGVLPGYEPLSVTSLTSGGNDGPNTSFATASITPTGDRLVLAWVRNRSVWTEPPGAGSSGPPTLSGCGITWVEVASAEIGNTDYSWRTTLFRGMVASPSSGAVTIDFGAASQEHCYWSIAEWSGIDTSGTHGSGAIVQSGTATSAAAVTSLTVTLNAFEAASNGVAYGINYSSVTPEVGYTELHDVFGTGGIFTEYMHSQDTSPSASWDDGQAYVAAVAVEIRKKVATGLWVVLYDDIATDVAAQKTESFIADSADTTTGDSTYYRYNWAGAIAAGASSTLDYTQRYRKIANRVDDKGEPLSVNIAADTCHAANTLYGHKTRCEYVNMPLASEQAQTGTTRKLVYGPVPIELFGGNARAVKVSARMKTSAGTATARFVFSDRIVRGTTSTTQTYNDGGVIYAEVTTTSTTHVWTSEATVSEPWRTGLMGGAGAAWLTVEIAATAGDTVTLAAVRVREDTL